MISSLRTCGYLIMRGLKMGGPRTGSAAQGGQPQSRVLKNHFSIFFSASWPDLQASLPNSEAGSREAARKKKRFSALTNYPFYHEKKKIFHSGSCETFCILLAKAESCDHPGWMETLQVTSQPLQLEMRKGGEGGQRLLESQLVVFATNNCYHCLQRHGVDFTCSSRRRGYGRRIRLSSFFVGTQN